MGYVHSASFDKLLAGSIRLSQYSLQHLDNASTNSDVTYLQLKKLEQLEGDCQPIIFRGT